jgi:hypothetical protein
MLLQYPVFVFYCLSAYPTKLSVIAGGESSVDPHSVSSELEKTKTYILKGVNKVEHFSLAKSSLMLQT